MVLVGSHLSSGPIFLESKVTVGVGFKSLWGDPEGHFLVTFILSWFEFFGVRGVLAGFQDHNPRNLEPRSGTPKTLNISRYLQESLIFSKEKPNL